jgi:hypothetical protein
MRAADDFHIIRARMAELQRERDRAVPRKDNDNDLSRRTRSVDDLDERLSVDIEDRTPPQKTKVLHGRG